MRECEVRIGFNILHANRVSIITLANLFVGTVSVRHTKLHLSANAKLESQAKFDTKRSKYRLRFFVSTVLFLMQLHANANI